MLVCCPATIVQRSLGLMAASLSASSRPTPGADLRFVATHTFNSSEAFSVSVMNSYGASTDVLTGSAHVGSTTGITLVPFH